MKESLIFATEGNQDDTILILFKGKLSHLKYVIKMFIK